jgi:hypothetical protein
VGIATLVPKPHLPFSGCRWQQNTRCGRSKNCSKKCCARRVSNRTGTTTRRLLEAVLSRGDRRLGPAIYRAWGLGAHFDGWSDQFR